MASNKVEEKVIGTLLDSLGSEGVSEPVLSPKDRKDWKSEGFTDEEEIKTWVRFGFTPKGARKWERFSPEVAVACVILGYTPARAKPWIDQGFAYDFYMVPVWEKYGFTPREAKEWRDLDISPKKAYRLREKGYKKAKEFRKKLLSFEDIWSAWMFELEEIYCSSAQ